VISMRRSFAGILTVRRSVWLLAISLAVFTALLPAIASAGDGGKRRCNGPARSRAAARGRGGPACCEAMRKGAYALQFATSGDLALNRFQGSVLSAKRHFSRSRAVRFGISGSIFSDDSGEDDRYTVADTAAFEDRQSNRDRECTVGIDLQYLHYTAPRGRLIGFTGCGPLAEYGWRDSYRQDLFHSGSHDSRMQRRGWTVGASGLIGVEWFASRSVSLHTEYGMRVAYEWSRGRGTVHDYPANRTGRTSSSSHGWRVSGSLVQLGISAYL
jgi:hypothetical protein